MALIRFGISLEDSLLERFDNLIERKGYPSRSEAIRDLIRDALVMEDWKTDISEAVGTITIVYNHEKRELTDLLTDMQHEHYDSIISSMHIHLDEHNCLEVIVVIGDIEFELSMVECRSCGGVISPFRDVIGIVSWQRTQEGLKERILELLTDLPYRRTERQSFEFTDVFVSKSQLNKWVLEDDWSGIVFDVDMEEIKEVYADGTKIKKQDGTKGDLRLLIGKTGKGKIVPIGVWIDKGWDEIGEELKEMAGEVNFKGKVLLSDGEQGIENHLLFKDMNHQRCLWHGSRDLGYVLWKDGLDKKARDMIVEDFKKVINITVDDRETIIERLERSQKSLNELTTTFKERGLEASATYVENLSRGLFTYVTILLERGESISKTTGSIERCIREVGRRIKKVGGSWTNKGAINLIRLLWKRVFEGDELQRFWKDRFGLNGNCQISLVEVSCKI